MDVATDFSSVLCDVNTIIEEKKKPFPQWFQPSFDDWWFWHVGITLKNECELAADFKGLGRQQI